VNIRSHHISPFPLPYGEEMAAQKAPGDFSSRYKFNGKEPDPETGLYYYGARYYHPAVSQWLSVDPLAEKYPFVSPYTYTYDNPVMFVDPTGMAGMKSDGDYYGKNGKYLGSDGIDDGKIYIVTDSKEKKYIKKKFKNKEAFSPDDIKNKVQLPGLRTLEESVSILETVSNDTENEFPRVVMKNGEVREGNELGNGKSTIEYSQDEIPEIEATIHFHTLKIWKENGELLYTSAEVPSIYDKEVFKDIKHNVILGYIGKVYQRGNQVIKPKIGASYYFYNSLKISLSKNALKKIVKHQHQLNK